MKTKILLAVATVLVPVAGYFVGYYEGNSDGFSKGYTSSPGPYIPSEDSFDYANHHCVVKPKGSF